MEETISVPGLVHALTTTDLNTLKKFLGGNGRGVFAKLLKAQIERFTEELVNRMPGENANKDFHSLGTLQGVRETHIYYRDLEKMVDQELRNREQIDKLVKSV